jgi:hypothetical protein
MCPSFFRLRKLLLVLIFISDCAVLHFSFKSTLIKTSHKIPVVGLIQLATECNNPQSRFWTDPCHIQITLHASANHAPCIMTSSRRNWRGVTDATEAPRAHRQRVWRRRSHCHWRTKSKCRRHFSIFKSIRAVFPVPRFRIARFSLKGEIREILPLAVRAAILQIRPNFPSVVNLSQKKLHHRIRRIASWDMFTFLVASHVLTYSAPRGGFAPRCALW